MAREFQGKILEEDKIWSMMVDQYLSYKRQEEEAKAKKDEFKQMMIDYTKGEQAKGNGIVLVK